MPFGAKGPRASDLESADSELQVLQQPGLTETLPGRPQRGAVWDGIGRAGRWEQTTKESCLQLDREYNITVMLNLKKAGKSNCHGKVRVEGGGACSSTYGMYFLVALTQMVNISYI